MTPTIPFCFLKPVVCILPHLLQVQAQTNPAEVHKTTLTSQHK